MTGKRPYQEMLDRFIDNPNKASVRLDMHDLVHTDSPDGFALYFEMKRSALSKQDDQPLPKHALGWVDFHYDIPNGRFVNEAFRGSIKTSTFTEDFTSYQIGLHPERSNMFVQASDRSAEDAASNIADMITQSAIWQMFFPDVVPDEDKGWGKDGRWVKQTGVPEWEQRRHRNPTLLGASYSASIVVGKHPTGVFVIDDINDDKNTESDRRNEEVNRIVRATLFPMLESTRHGIFNQTPWTRKDALALVKETGVWSCLRTPVLYPVDSDFPGAELIEVTDSEGNVLYSQWATLTWPENFDVAKIIEKYKEVKAKEFARMYLLNLKAMEGINLKDEWLHDMPNEQINPNWPVYFGVDYASPSDLVKTKEPDFFSVTIGQQMPSGRAMVVDGFRGRLPQGEAEQKLKSMAMMYPNLVSIGVELDGTGRGFYSTLVRTTDLPVWPTSTKGKGKGHRFEKIMAPYFEFSKVWVAENKTPFLRAFKDEWLTWPDGQNDDTLDSTFYCLDAMGMFVQHTSDVTDEPYPYGAWHERRKETISPWKEIVKHG